MPSDRAEVVVLPEEVSVEVGLRRFTLHIKNGPSVYLMTKTFSIAGLTSGFGVLVSYLGASTGVALIASAVGLGTAAAIISMEQRRARPPTAPSAGLRNRGPAEDEWRRPAA